MKKLLVIPLSLLALMACKKTEANFTEPQPTNTKNIEAFPQKLKGIYHNYENDADVTINEQSILLKYNFQDTLNQQKTDELMNDTQITKTQLNDSLFVVKYSVVDTLFDAKNGDIIKKWKGHYFLNIQNANKNWEVKKLTYKNNMISISDITSEESLSMLDEITGTENDTLRPKTYTITKKQFKEFVKQNGFSTKDSYIKEN